MGETKRKRTVGEPRKRRTSDEARAAILDAAETMLRDVGPGGIRLQEVARQVGVSHPTVLHHFGSREGLLDAVVARSLASVQAGFFEAIADSKGADDVGALIEGAAARLKEKGRARSFLWLALGRYGPGVKGLHVNDLAQAVHAERKVRWAKRGKKAPPFEDSWFAVLMPALALLSSSVLEDCAEPDFDPARFRAWMAKSMHRHLEEGP